LKQLKSLLRYTKIKNYCVTFNAKFSIKWAENHLIVETTVLNNDLPS